ncbi:hypothetical protein BJX68DRAFT_250677 [Aspergillus pseudodeflectus]|uniref:Cyanovirin-N domain-containing protein n=1 Tax=Aspergillus pseudodeflectus TaxID=176178 RepID=A0ABR4J9M5_9EURO
MAKWWEVAKDISFNNESKDAILSAKLPDQHGKYWDSSVSLNKYIGVEYGILQWGGRLVGVTSDVKDLGFSSGNPPYLTCLARNLNGGFVTTKFELSEMNVSNNNGAFSIDTRGGPHDPRTFHSTTIVFEAQGNQMAPIVFSLINGDKWTFSSCIYRGSPGNYDIPFQLPLLRSSNAKITWAGSSPNVWSTDFFGSLGRNWFDLKFRNEDGVEEIVVEGFLDGHSTEKKGGFLYNIAGHGGWSVDLNIASRQHQRRKLILRGEWKEFLENDYREKLGEPPMTDRQMKVFQIKVSRYARGKKRPNAEGDLDTNWDKLGEDDLRDD